MANKMYRGAHFRKWSVALQLPQRSRAKDLLLACRVLDATVRTSYSIVRIMLRIVVEKVGKAEGSERTDVVIDEIYVDKYCSDSCSDGQGRDCYRPPESLTYQAFREYPSVLHAPRCSTAYVIGCLLAGECLAPAVD